MIFEEENNNIIKTHTYRHINAVQWHKLFPVLILLANIRVHHFKLQQPKTSHNKLDVYIKCTMCCSWMHDVPSQSLWSVCNCIFHIKLFKHLNNTRKSKEMFIICLHWVLWAFKYLDTGKTGNSLQAVRESDKNKWVKEGISGHFPRYVQALPPRVTKHVRCCLITWVLQCPGQTTVYCVSADTGRNGPEKQFQKENEEVKFYMSWKE